MNWVGGARSRVRARNERKLQKEFFERKRHNGGGPLKHVKHHIQRSSPPMKGSAVNYKKLISQDLLSLRTLQQTSDDGIMNIDDKITKGTVLKVPQKINLSSKPQPYNSNYNLELSTSPISQPSTLELQDVNSIGGVSLYEDQPRVSTEKASFNNNHLIPPPHFAAKKKQLNMLSNNEENSCDVSLTESIFPSSHKYPPLPPPSHESSLFSYIKPSTQPNNHHLLFSNPLNHTTSGRSELPINTTINNNDNNLLPLYHKGTILDTERPLGRETFIKGERKNKLIRKREQKQPFELPFNPMKNTLDTERPIGSISFMRKEERLHAPLELPIKDTNTVTNNGRIPYYKRVLDTERPLVIEQESFIKEMRPREEEKQPLFDWSNVDWYKQKKIVKKREGDDNLLDNKRRKTIYDGEIPFPTGQGLLDFHKTEQGCIRSPSLVSKSLEPHIPLEPRLSPHYLTNACNINDTKSSSTAVNLLLEDEEEDPVGLTAQSFITPSSSPPLIITGSSLVCSESLSQMSDTIINSSDSTRKRPCAFETMIKAFEKPFIDKKEQADVASCPHKVKDNTNESGDNKKTLAQNHKWMDFIQGSGASTDTVSHAKSIEQLENSNLEETISELPLVIPSNSFITYDKDELHLNELLSQDIVLTPQIKGSTVSVDCEVQCTETSIVDSLEASVYSSICEPNNSDIQATSAVESLTNTVSFSSLDNENFITDSLQTNNSVFHSIAAQTDTTTQTNTTTQTDNSMFTTQTNNSMFHSTTTQTDNSMFHSTTTQTDNSMFHSTTTQTDISMFQTIKDYKPTLDSSVAAQAGTVCDLHDAVLQELARSYNSLLSRVAAVSSEDNQQQILNSLCTEVDNLIKRINEQQNTIIWYTLMCKLKSL